MEKSMYERLTTCFALSFVGGISIFAGCSYELPQVSTTSSTGSGQGGTGGAGSTSSSGQGGQGGGISSSSSGQGGAMGMCVEAEKPVCAAYSGPAGTENIGTCKA